MGEVDFHLAPEWLSVEYLQPVLQKYKKDNALKIIELEMKPATAKGENYASVMTRIRVDFHLNGQKCKQTGYYIVKTSHDNDPYISNIMTPYDMYNTEMRMYEKILPQLSQLLKEIGDEYKLFAETIHVDYERSAIIFEDLAISEFVMADRLTGMDMAHAKFALKKLAKMHATAAVLNERVPGSLQRFDHGIVNRHTRSFGPFFENMLNVCAQYSEECAELGDYYKQKLLRLKERVVEYATRACDMHTGHFHTLNHGDFWVNNMMLRYEEKHLPSGTPTATRQIKDLMLIDFQFCTWASPAVDLHYFFNTSLEGELRLHHQDELVQYYHQILTHTLQQLQFGGYTPTLHEFCVQMEAGRFYALISALAVQPIMLNEKTEDADLKAMLTDDERGRNFRKLLYTNKMVQGHVKALLPFFDRRGLLDVTD